MGQLDLLRTQFEARVTVTVPANDDRQLVNFTGYFVEGDVVDVIEVDSNGNVLQVISDNRTVMAIDPDVSLTLDAVVNTSGLTGTPMIRAQNIDDGFEAVDRLYRRVITANVQYVQKQAILGEALATPTAGKTTYFVEDISYIRAGDILDILADQGIVGTNVTVDSLSPNADDVNNLASVVINSNLTTVGFTNPKLVVKSLTVQQAIARNQEKIDQIDRPVENEYLGVGNGSHMAFEAANLFVAGTSKFLIDGNRKRLGTAGTRANLTQGSGNAQMLFTSMILGTKGNATRVAVINAAGTAVSVTGNSTTGYLVSVNNNSGTATAAQIAAAINADATAKRIVQCRYGGTGASAAVAFAATNLASGLDNGTGDYAEIEQVYNNLIANTGYKFISLWILPNDTNRLSKPPKDDEELVIDYRRPSDNVNR